MSDSASHTVTGDSKAPAVLPSMNPGEVCEALYRIGTGWQGKGLAVECASWLGGSTAWLAAGLADAGYHHELHCYDRWKASVEEVRKARKLGVTLQEREDLLPRFRANIKRQAVRITPRRGPIQRMPCTSGN